MNEMIEKLKKNKIPFGLLEPEEQECFRKVGESNCVKYVGLAMNWKELSQFEFLGTYRIKPDYKPEYVDLEIKRGGGHFLGVFSVQPFMPHNFTHLHCLPSLPGFEGFYLTSGNKQTEVRAEWVSRHFPNVIARFRTGGEKAGQ